MHTSILSCWIGVLFYLATLTGVSGQVVGSSQSSQSVAPSTPAQPISQTQSTLQAFQQEQQALFQERQALIDQEATPEQLAAWQQQNSARFAAQQQLAQKMATASALQLMPTDMQPSIPPNASPTLRAFLTAQANQANARAQIHNQLLQTLPANASAAQVGQMQQQEMQLVHQQHAANSQLQAQRAETLASESAQTPLPALPPLQVPPNATPQLAAYLTQRYQLMQSQVQLSNQYASATPAVRQAALSQWQQQNAAAIQQMQQQAQALSNADPVTHN
jgi:hypothetical protein